MKKYEKWRVETRAKCKMEKVIPRSSKLISRSFSVTEIEYKSVYLKVHLDPMTLYNK